MSILKLYLEKIYSVWMKFAKILGTINSYIILTVLYFILFGIYSILEKVFKLPLFLLKNSKKESYWRKKNYETPTKEILKRQF